MVTENSKKIETDFLNEIGVCFLYFWKAWMNRFYWKVDHYVVDLLVWKLKGLSFFVGKFLLGKQMFEFLGGFE